MLIRKTQVLDASRIGINNLFAKQLSFLSRASLWPAAQGVRL